MRLLKFTFKYAFWVLMALVLFVVAVIAGLYQESTKNQRK